jgi:hypothetical protein
MPKGPKGEKRPADVIGNAVHVMRIATGQIVDDPAPKKDASAAKRGRPGGLKGGKARAKKLTPRQRSEVAQLAAQARWKNG